MKSAFLFLLVFVATFASPARSQTVGTPGFDPLGEYLDLQQLIRIQIEWIEMPQENLTALMEAPRRGADDTDLRNKAFALVKEGKARVIDTSILTTRSGQRAKVESVKEVIYPTDFVEAVPRKRTNATSGNPAGNQTEKSAPRHTVPPTPTAFDVRNVGTTVEVDPIIGSDGLTVDLNLVPEIVYHVGDALVSKWKTKEAEAVLTQPYFYTIRASLALATIAGTYHLMAVVTPKDDLGDPDPENKVLLFVKSDILYVGK